MSEFLPQSPERESQPLDNGERQRENLENIKKNAENTPEVDKNVIENLEKHAKQEAISGRETNVAEREQPHHHQPTSITKAAKKQAYKKTLSHARKHLSKPERTLSKVIHQPVIEKASEVGSQTIARPSGLLSGGICAFIGSLFFLYMSKHYGFAYNFFVFILFLIGGFMVGLLVELIWNATRKPRRRSS